ncbi:outer membrane lipoprotein carrier protein LolA [Tateyamaria pelophila]|uniref:outer membrane lipoprotein carrier protein LolA n=1 Tax=Tateyamaria pelophila TaxID=328415 RepID=UPI0037DA25F6
MKLLKRMAVVVLASVVAQGAWADKLPLADISGYLNDLKTVQARFTQINDDGTTDTGTVYIKRPGKMRFEYDPPNSALVVASANAVYIADSKSNQQPETYPLRQTPLSIILARNVDLSREKMVVGHDFDGTATVITAQDPENSEYGSIQMKFTDAPVQLRQWVVNDSGGGQTTVILGEMTTGGTLSNRLFNPPSREN